MSRPLKTPVITLAILAASVAALAGTSACDTSDEAYEKAENTPPYPATANPTCGSPGDLVLLDVYLGEDSTDRARCDTPDDVDVQFTGANARPESVDDTYVDLAVDRPGHKTGELAKGERCAVRVRIPSGATSGSILVRLPYGGTSDHSQHIAEPAVFQIPCAADAGGPALDGGSSDGGGDQGPYLGHVYVLSGQVPSASTLAGGSFFSPKTAEDQAAVASIGEDVQTDFVPTVPKGTCVAGDFPGTTPGMPSAAADFNVGTPVSINATGAAPFLMPRVGTNYYASDAVALPRGAAFTVNLPGEGAFLATVLNGSFAPAMTITSPAEGATLSKASGFTVTFTPFAASSLILRAGALQRFTCNVDPQAGSITVPSSVLTNFPSGSEFLEFRALNQSSTPVNFGGVAGRAFVFGGQNYRLGVTF